MKNKVNIICFVLGCIFLIIAAILMVQIFKTKQEIKALNIKEEQLIQEIKEEQYQ